MKSQLLAVAILLVAYTGVTLVKAQEHKSESLGRQLAVNQH